MAPHYTHLDSFWKIPMPTFYPDQLNQVSANEGRTQAFVTFYSPEVSLMCSVVVGSQYLFKVMTYWELLFNV